MENITVSKEDLQEALQSIKITFVIATLIAIFNWLIITESTFLVQFLSSQSIALSMVTIYLVANILYPKLQASFKYQYYLLPFPVLISTLIGMNFLHEYTSFLTLYILVLLMSLPILLVFQFIDSKKTSNASLKIEKQKRNLSEKQLLESKLLLLQAQINPHFLFNTLANIDAYIDEDPQQAKSLLQNYSRFLRCSLETTQNAQCVIKNEVDLITAYMHIQQIRFPNISFVQKITDNLLSTQIPPLLIQPLIENALLHGLAPKGNRGTIKLTIEQQQHNLMIKVSDDGVGISNTKSNSNGIALKNIESRLALYKDNCHFHITSNDAGGVDARINIPI